MNSPYQILLELEKQHVQYKEIGEFDEYIIQQFFPTLESNELLWKYCQSKFFSEKEAFQDPEFITVFEEIFLLIQKLIKLIRSELNKKDREQFSGFFRHARIISIPELDAVGLCMSSKKHAPSNKSQDIGDAYDAICYVLENLNNKDWYLKFPVISDTQRLFNAEIGFNDEFYLREAECNRSDTEYSRKKWIKDLRSDFAFLESLVAFIDSGALTEITKSDIETLHSLTNNKISKIFQRYICDTNDYYKDLRSYYINTQIMDTGKGEFYSKFDVIGQESIYYSWSGRGGFDEKIYQKKHIQKCYLNIMPKLT
jgi:hypothetical protein